MGTTSSQFEFLKAERIIDNENEGVFIGISQPDLTNPLSSQAIRFGQNDLAKLILFTSSKGTLTYTFEHEIELKFLKTPSGSIVISYANPALNLNVRKEWAHRNFWKNLSWGSASTQFDQIGELIKID
jgi:hypothetical protein